MARPRTNFDPTRESLLRSACRLFSERGFDETSIGSIMREAGLSKAGLYHYFSSKEEILEEAIELYLSRGIERLRADFEGRTLAERIAIFLWGAVEPDELARGLAAMKGSRPDSFAAYRIRERSLGADIPILAELLAEGMDRGLYRRSGSPRATAALLVLAVKAVAEAGVLPPAEAAEAAERREALLDLVAAWLAPPPEHLAVLREALEAEPGAGPAPSASGL